MLVKLPPAKILPSACTAIERIASFAFGLNESAEPVVASSRAMRLRICPPMLLKLPPTKILPSACTAIERTVKFALGSNESAKPVVASSRAMKFRGCPPMLFVPLKLPPTKILPSACTAIDQTVAFAFGLKAVSSVPSGFSRAMRLRVTAPPPLGESVVKSPPIKILPSGWTTTTRTVLFACGSKPSSADCPRTAAAPPANVKPTRAIKLNRADERNLFPAEFFIFGFPFRS